ncbi:MAG: thioesterase family protein [Microlunatus sp.]|nr:thioesterase family protein [Microlunatus sp.]
MPFHYRVPKRQADLNAAGEVDHAVVIDYLQEARTEFLLSAPGPMPQMLDSGVLVTAHHVAYLAPIPGDHPVVDAEVWVDQVGGARFSISYRLADAGTPVVTARSFLAPYDLAGGGLRRLSDPERKQLSAAVEPPVFLEPLGRIRPAELTDAHTFSCRVRWADLDAYRHVNNVKFFDYLSQARSELLADAGPPAPGEYWRVARQDIDYKTPIDFRREPYQVRTAVVAVGSTSVWLAADIVDPLAGTPRPYATARAELVLIGADGSQRQVPDPVRAALTSRRAASSPSS